MLRHPQTRTRPERKSQLVDALTNPEKPHGVYGIIRDVERTLARHTKRQPRAESLPLTSQAKTA